jgi:hypothetical protein
MAKRCWLFHDWTHWVTFQKGEVVPRWADNPDEMGRPIEWQQRVCTVCNKKQIRECRP